MDVFKFTDDQRAALKLLGGMVRNVLLFGGSRSGKTLILLFSIVLRALKAPGSRHAVFRYRKTMSGVNGTSLLLFAISGNIPSNYGILHGTEKCQTRNVRYDYLVTDSGQTIQKLLNHQLR